MRSDAPASAHSFCRRARAAIWSPWSWRRNRWPRWPRRSCRLLEELEKGPSESRADLPTEEEEVSVPSLREPIEPAFRVGQLGLGYDERQDLMVLIAQAMPDAGDEGQDLAAEHPSETDVSPEPEPKARFLCDAGADALLERACPAGCRRRPAGLPSVWARHRAGWSLLSAHQRPRITRCQSEFSTANIAPQLSASERPIELAPTQYALPMTK